MPVVTYTPQPYFPITQQDPRTRPSDPRVRSGVNSISTSHQRNNVSMSTNPGYFQPPAEVIEHTPYDRRPMSEGLQRFHGISATPTGYESLPSSYDSPARTSGRQRRAAVHASSNWHDLSATPENIDEASVYGNDNLRAANIQERQSAGQQSLAPRGTLTNPQNLSAQRVPIDASGNAIRSTTNRLSELHRSDPPWYDETDAEISAYHRHAAPPESFATATNPYNPRAQKVPVDASGKPIRPKTNRLQDGRSIAKQTSEFGRKKTRTHPYDRRTAYPSIRLGPRRRQPITPKPSRTGIGQVREAQTSKPYTGSEEQQEYVARRLRGLPNEVVDLTGEDQYPEVPPRSNPQEGFEDAPEGEEGKSASL